MRILYGVQGTGNGHITRARAMQRALSRKGVDVDWVFSGRDRHELFDMDVFGDFTVFRGLSFATRSGKIDVLKTVAEASFVQMHQDIRTLDLSRYDLIVSDFEPVVAWAAKNRNLPCVGIGHQYAFDYDIPKLARSFASEAILKWFAPVTLGIGVHWHHFNQPILPPIIEADHADTVGAADRTLVYLPFENSENVMRVLRACHHPFIFHCRDVAPGQYDNVLVRGFSREGFRDSLHSTDGVICNAGFELASEALCLGRRLLMKPLHGQMEQSSNALALTRLGLGLSTDRIDEACIRRYLNEAPWRRVRYPDVPMLLADWLQDYPRVSLDDLVSQAWQGVQLPGTESVMRAHGRMAA